MLVCETSVHLYRSTIQITKTLRHMKTSEILKTGKQVYYSKQSAKDALKFITDLAGIKSIECDNPSDYITFINLQKEVLLKSGVTLHAIWIKSTYDSNDKKIFQISLQTDDSYSMRIAKFINERVEAGTLLLTESMVKKVLNPTV